jgi:Lipocalin-like domain
VIYPFYGKYPEGLLIYDRNGWMSVQIVSDPKPTVPHENSRESFLAAPANEKLIATNGYYAYYGTWTVDPSNATITHHIQQSLYPGERGESAERHFSNEGQSPHTFGESS